MPDKRPLNNKGYPSIIQCNHCMAKNHTTCMTLLRKDAKEKNLYKCNKCTKDGQGCIMDGEDLNRLRDRATKEYCTIESHDHLPREDYEDMGFRPAQLTPIHLVKQVWERIAPLGLAERSWDNVGIMIEAPFPRPEARKVMLTIDLTTAVAAEAESIPSCSVVVSYHPPIFRGLKSLTMSDPLQASLLRLASRGISVFTPHTSLDATPKGINTWLAEPFKNIASSSVPITTSPHIDGFEGAGMGKLVKLHARLSVQQVVRMVKEHLGLQYLQLATPDIEKPVESIAICAGSGASMFKDVDASLLLTGEMSHHEVLASLAKGQSVILANHSNTERPYLSKVLKPWLEASLNAARENPMEQIEQWEVIVSKADADPLRVV